MLPRILSVLAILSLALVSAAAAPAGDRMLRDVLGEVLQLRETVVEDGTVWLDVSLTTRDGEVLEARLAPVDVLAANDFHVEVGDTARVRLFVDEQPAGVSRIRNLSSGQTLRLRCLRGEPIWNLREPQGAGPAGHGPGPRGRRGPG